MAGIPTTLSGIVGFVMITAFLFSLFPTAPSNKAVTYGMDEISKSTAFINRSATVDSNETVLGSHALAVGAGLGATLLGFAYFAVTDMLLVATLLSSWVTMVVTINPILSFAGAVMTVLLVIEVAKRLTWGNH